MNLPMNSNYQEDRSHIQEVWAENLEEEFAKIRDIVERYHYVALDTEFPGIVVRPNGDFENLVDYNYQTIKFNVDLLNVIQLGLTFTDSYGNPPPGVSTWQFNFKFDIEKDCYSPESIEFLKNSGVDFHMLRFRGIEYNDFAELIISSGLVLNQNIKWISYHGSFDFGYILKLLTSSALPDTYIDFIDVLKDFFPKIYDIRYLLRSIENPDFQANTIQCACDILNVRNDSKKYRNDATLIVKIFFELVRKFFNNTIDESKFCGVLFGIGTGS